MKRIFIVLIVTALVSSAVFARGTMDNAAGERSGSGRIDGEEVVLDGIIGENDGRITLANSNGTWSLSAPGFPRYNVEIPMGETVEIAGTMNVCDDDCDCDLETDGHVFVKSALFNGEEYIFDAPGNRLSGTGSRNGSGRQDTPRNAAGETGRGRNGLNGMRPMDGSGRDDGNRGYGRGRNA